MKNKVCYVLLMICILCMLCACGKKEEILEEAPITETLITEVPEDTTGEELDFAGHSIQEIFEQSYEYAEQMAKGEFGIITEQFSDTLSEQIDEEALKEVWESVVNPIGGYLEPEKELQQQVIKENQLTCLIVLRYEESGLSLTLTYNQQMEISALYINYYPLEADEHSEPVIKDERENVITFGSDQYPIQGILTLPSGVNNPPVVILVQGSGQSDMDETIGLEANKPFYDLAMGLADQGIATIRYPKRFYTYPMLATVTSTIYDEVLDDVTLAIQWAASDGRVDSERIYVAGHSLGGMLSPKIAQMNPEVKGIISLAGSPRGLEDIIYDQNKEVLEQMVEYDVYSEEEAEELLKEVEKMVQQVKMLSEEQLADTILGVPGYYWESLNEIDTAQIVKSLTIPILILQGEEDFQVYPDVDFELWKDILSEKENARFKRYKNLNHLFMETTGLRGMGDYDVKSNVSQEVIDDIASWIMTGE